MSLNNASDNSTNSSRNAFVASFLQVLVAFMLALQ